MMQKRAILTIIVLSLVASLATGCCCVSPKKQLDDQNAVASGDYTGVIAIEADDCGFEPTKATGLPKNLRLFTGFLSCRVTEGSTANEQVFFVGPDASCAGDNPCVEFKIFNSSGKPTFGAGIPKGQTRVGVPWSQLIHREAFQKNDRGLWGYSYSIRYDGPDGLERTMYTQGEIYLRVLTKEYVPLTTVSDDPNYFWIWDEDGSDIKMTTGGRTFVGKKWRL